MSITLALLIITGIISYQGLSNYSIVDSLKHHPYSEHHKKEYYRMLSSGFVHGSMSHMLINLFVLYMFGSTIEIYFKAIYGEVTGLIYFTLMYLLAIIFADIPTHFKYKDNYNYAAVGASGATSAIVLIFCILNPWEWFIYPPVPAIIFAIGYLWYSHWADTKGRSDGIGHSAHLYGSVFGILFLLLTKPSLFGYFATKIMEGPIWPPPFFG